ncbi:MAG: daunorubicin ABC transporter ATP-binding protein [Bdellovibrio sp. CG10_big_fil_rev_8_21_14_0_10_47_8]|nr:MAG: daunorubicin ABC transporter ATP-binding protein [Bdellovibrio sp. CG10_big_fil_rev_8_21_14_0_10_47_8]
MSLVIETKDLSRVFVSYEKPEGLLESLRGFWDRKHIEKTALAPTTLQIESGQIIGLVGANGAGKTTLLKLLSGLIHPSSGTASVLGFQPWERKSAFLKRISILLGQKNQLWWDLAPNDSFALLAEIYDLDRKTALMRVQELAELLECKHVLQTQLRRLSLGERMKMEIIGSLLHSPEILFLDEPTIGLDIVAQTSIRKFLGEYVREKGPTVILTSHYMDDIAKLADRLLLISKGQFVYDGTVQGFVAKTESLQKITFSLIEPLPENLQLMDGLELSATQQEFSVEVSSKDLAPILGKITRLPGIHNLKFEEADFEDIIHRFLEKESRVLSPGGHH